MKKKVKTSFSLEKERQTYRVNYTSRPTEGAVVGKRTNAWKRRYLQASPKLDQILETTGNS